MGTQIAVTDTRLVIGGHAENKAVCLAVSIAAQTFARILGAQGLLARTVEVGVEPPVFDLQTWEEERAYQGISGFLDTILRIARNYPGEITVADNRTVWVRAHRPPQPEPQEETVPSFAMSLQPPSRLTVPNGRHTRKVA